MRWMEALQTRWHCFTVHKNVFASFMWLQIACMCMSLVYHGATFCVGWEKANAEIYIAKEALEKWRE